MIRDGIQGRIIRSTRNPAKWAANTTLATAQQIWWRRADSITGAGSGGVRHTVHSLMLGNLLKSPMFQSLFHNTRPSWVSNRSKSSSITSKSTAQTRLRLSGCAEYAAVLASPKASYCTGQSINVTGGQVCSDQQRRSFKDLRATNRMPVRYAYQAYRTSATTSRRSYGSALITVAVIAWCAQLALGGCKFLVLTVPSTRYANKGALAWTFQRTL